MAELINFIVNYYLIIMKNNALSILLSGKKYLLLQGPMGPFFNDVAEWLESLGRNAVNVVFNGGDRFYCRHRHYLAYYQTPKEFPRLVTRYPPAI